MIAVPDDAPWLDKTQRAERVASDLHLHADMVVRSRTHFAERLHLIASMPATIVREGRLLYDRGDDGWNVKPLHKAQDTAEWMQKASSVQNNMLRLRR